MVLRTRPKNPKSPYLFAAAQSRRPLRGLQEKDEEEEEEEEASWLAALAPVLPEATCARVSDVCRAGNRASEPDFGRILNGKASTRPSGRPKAGRRADFDIFPVRIRPASGPEARFLPQKHYCATYSSYHLQNGHFPFRGFQSRRQLQNTFGI